VGFTQGLSFEILTLAGVVAAVLVSIHNYSYLGTFLAEKVNLPIEFINFFSFILFVIITYLIFRYLKIMFYKLIKLEIFPGVERGGGLILGFIRGCLLSSLILLCLLFIPNEYVRDSISKKSLAGGFFIKIAPGCYTYTLGSIPGFNRAAGEKILEEVLEEKTKKRYKKRDPQRTKR